MKHTVLAFTVAIALSACSKGGNGDNGPIPPDIQFNEKALPPISDADFARAKLVAQTAGGAASPKDQVLIKNNETANDQSRREAEFNKMPAALQRLVREWQSDCKSNHQKAGKGIEGTPRPGQVFKSTESNSTTGNRCPVRMNEQTESTINVISFTKTPLNFGITVNHSGHALGAYDVAAQQQVVGAVSFGMSFKMSGRFERASDVRAAYSRMDADGFIETLKYGKLIMQASSQNLERNGVDKTLTTTRLSEGANTFVFTQYWDQMNKISSMPRFFIGNRELTLQEVQAMGEFPFTPSRSR